jgi:hypothetical protein
MQQARQLTIRATSELARFVDATPCPFTAIEVMAAENP